MIIGIICDFMFYNTCILFFELSFFGLGPELESDQALQPLTLLCPPNLVRRTTNGRRLGQNGSAKLALALSHIVPNGY
jgi:hypothetical protein